MASIDTHVAVIGAGPTGSVLAGSLAEQGHRVFVFEKNSFPRFHIGESLLPMTEPYFREFGLELDDEEFAIQKHGALFYEAETNRTEPVPFSRTRDGTPSYAHQVKRSAFDQKLVELARSKGAEIHFNQTVSGWDEQEDFVHVRFDDHPEIRCRYLVDASGQRAMMGRQHETVEHIDDFGRVATYTHYKNVPWNFLPEAMQNGEILIALVGDGWLWGIPLSNGWFSVGRVERNPDPEPTKREAVLTAIEQIQPISDLDDIGTRVNPVQRCSGYSYVNRQPHTRRTVCVGDAHAFLDPIFSTAIHLAVSSATQLSEELDEHLNENDPLKLDDYLEWIEYAHHLYGRLIHRFYQKNWVHNTFFTSDRPESLVRDVTSILAGDIRYEKNRFLNMLMNTSDDVLPTRIKG